VHTVVVDGHALPQVPWAQTSFAPQAVSHAPQCDGSFFGSTQLPPQASSDAAHVATQPPWRHTEPAAHTVPHAPQLSESVRTSTQALPHCVQEVGAPLTHAPSPSASAATRDH
jgi:hypothetical protein